MYRKIIDSGKVNNVRAEGSGPKSGYFINQQHFSDLIVSAISMRN